MTTTFAGVRPIAGLLIAPAITIAAAVIAPHVTVSEPLAAGLAFAGAAIAGLAALAASARASLDRRHAITLAAIAFAMIGLVVLASPRPAIAAAIVNLALVAIAHAAGASIGRRVGHPGHLLPACAVAAAADLASVLNPSGPTHAIASSERALALFAIGFPVAGTRAIAPSIGVGDFVFLALVFGVATTHGISIARTTLCGAAGLAVAGILSARFAIPIPALVPIGAAIVVGLPAARRLRREDRTTAAVSVAIAAAVVLGTLLRPT